MKRLLLTALFLTTLGCAVPARAGQATYTVKEQVNRTWKRQMLTYPFEAKKGECHEDSLRLTGPNGPAPVQLSDVERWGDTPFVRTAKVSFFVDELLPLSEQTYTLDYGSAPASAPAPAPRLKVVKTDGAVEITTDEFGVRLLMGKKALDHPVVADEVPGPVSGLRMLDGTWTGGSVLYGDAGVASYEAKLIADGPVFAQVQTIYTYADGNTLELGFRIVGGDRALEIDAESAQHHPDAGWEVTVGGEKVKFTKGVLVAYRTRDTREVPVTLPADGRIARLSPWTGWWDTSVPTLMRVGADTPAGEVHLTIRDSGAWVKPRELSEVFHFDKFWPASLSGVWRDLDEARIDVIARNGALVLRSSNRQGVRRWTLSTGIDQGEQLATFEGLDQTAHTARPRLNEVKDMLLDWPTSEAARNPHLLLSAAELAAVPADSRFGRQLRQKHKYLADALNKLGDYDQMRGTMTIAWDYDTVINSDLITPEERALYRAQAAYAMHWHADPFVWSVERGYTSGNPNMTTSFVLNAGALALALRDHPHSGPIIQTAVRHMDYYLDHVADEQGYWPESNSYARVSWSNISTFGVLATRAGVKDYLSHPKFQKMALFYEMTLTPGDRTRAMTPDADPNTPEGAPRVPPRYGRGGRADVWAISGLVAKAMADKHPELSRILQWSWRQTGYGDMLIHHGANTLPWLYADRDLPTAVPDWSSMRLNHLGYLFRDHVGASEESYLFWITESPRSADGEIWPGDVGDLARWHGHNTVLSTVYEGHPLLKNRVTLATNWDPAKKSSPDARYSTQTTHRGSAMLPGLDFADVAFELGMKTYGYNFAMPPAVPAFPQRDPAGQMPITWRRQVMMVGDEAPAPQSPQYLVIRDTVAGGQPTQWQFWTLTEKLGTPEQAASREAFLTDKPGAAAAPARQLPAGQRYTGVGQFGVDIEYYIASPTDTPRYTLRYGEAVGAHGVQGKAPTFQDLMYLQLDGDGSYFVVIFPRRANEQVPTFKTEGDGKVIHLTGAFADHWAFLSDEPTTVEAGPVRFEGTAGHVRDNGPIVLALAAPGSIAYRHLRVEASHPVRLRSADGMVTFDVPADFPGGDIRWAGGDPASVRLVKPEQGVALNHDGSTFVLTLPAGARTVEVTRK